MLQILAFDPHGNPKLIGTGFVVGVSENKAVAITAAHNFHEGVVKIQNPSKRHHPSTPLEFLPDSEEIHVDPKKLRAIFRYGKIVDLCTIDFAVWERSTDFSFFAFTPQNSEITTPQIKELSIQKVEPKEGGIVAMLGFRGMATTPIQEHEGITHFSTKSQFICRVGRIKKIYRDGHLLCKGPCLETTIPVFPGMSGGPVFLLPEKGAPIIPFGLVSSDPDAPDEEKDNPKIPGSSIVSLLDPIFPDGEKHGNQLEFKMEKAVWVRRKIS